MSTPMNLDGQLAILAALGINPMGVESVSINVQGGCPPRVTVIRFLRDDEETLRRAIQQFVLMPVRQESAPMVEAEPRGPVWPAV